MEAGRPERRPGEGPGEKDQVERRERQRRSRWDGWSRRHLLPQPEPRPPPLCESITQAYLQRSASHWSYF